MNDSLKLQKYELCRSLMTADGRMEKLVLKHFEKEDYQKIMEHRLYSGRIGGKACGFLVARKIIENCLPEYKDFLLEHHSWFLGADFYGDYLKENENFNEKMEKALQKILDLTGADPYVVRSSSFLEDGFDGSFSGKYDSVFCINQGSFAEKMTELKAAVCQVFASMKNPSALEYRRVRGLEEKEEQMALLVQRVEGKHCGNYYFPLAAGMGCSYNPYKWMEEMNPGAGMLRIVAGLGTRAVERTPGDYPRLIGLDRARGNIHTTVEERHKFSQRTADVLSLSESKKTGVSVETLLEVLSAEERRIVFSQDTDAQRRLWESGRYREVFFADCEGIAKDRNFISMMSRILKVLEGEFSRAVDIEFAVEKEKDGLKMNLYQCRPLQQGVEQDIVFPKDKDDEILFDVRRTSMRNSGEIKLDYIIYVDPESYYRCPYRQKSEVRGVIEKINRYYGRNKKKMMLLVPGRIGTSSPELGVPVTYADISCFSAICEVACAKAGYHPELSYGSHMFQDFVEGGIYYGAINENSKTRIYHPEILHRVPDEFLRTWPQFAKMAGMIRVYDVSGQEARLLLNAKEGRAVCLITENTM